MAKCAFAIHAGAGLITVTEKNRSVIEQHLAELKRITEKGYSLLKSGASALDVVEEAVMMLENYDGFNAGRGAVLNSQGFAELDAAIMDGNDRAAGAIAAVKRVKNPISGARAVMQYSKHVLLAGDEADKFCEQHQIKMAEPGYFITKYRQQQLQAAQQEGKVQDMDSLGTVGAVARDIHGHLAAATSTGGKANKLPGRVGDSPIIGAGTWADNRTCAVSGTGDGEVFIRCAFTHQIHAYLSHQKEDLSAACRHALEEVTALGGEGGCIAIDKNGKVVVLFNSSGMFRGWVDEDGEIRVAAGRNS